MPTTVNRQIRLRRHPVGMPRPDDFDLVESPLPSPGAGEVLCRTVYLSLDPYMRGRMSEAKSYAKSAEVGQVMVGGAVGEVVASRHPKFKPGDKVEGPFGWQLFALSDGKGVRKIEERGGIPLSAYLGVLGMPGVTAHIGLLDIGQPKAGETVVVSAASGAVGGVVGQIAKIQGCRAVGIAGGADKCRFAVEELGYDACVDYKAGRLDQELGRAVPGGVDVYFDNVGGEVLAGVLRVINRGARIPLCGMISEYNATAIPGGPNLRPLLVHRAMIKGFIVSDHYDRFAAFLSECVPLVRDGRIKYREDIVEGLDAAPSALIGLFEGRNFGKMLVRVSADPTRR